MNAEEAPFLGTEHMLRADHFHNQPCPTDPPGGPPGETQQSAALRVELPRPAVRLGLLHLPPLRQPLVTSARMRPAPDELRRRSAAGLGRTAEGKTGPRSSAPAMSRPLRGGVRARGDSITVSKPALPRGRRGPVEAVPLPREAGSSTRWPAARLREIIGRGVCGWARSPVRRVRTGAPRQRTLPRISDDRRRARGLLPGMRGA